MQVTQKRLKTVFAASKTVLVIGVRHRPAPVLRLPKAGAA
jgi:hypothetical protein